MRSRSCKACRWRCVMLHADRTIAAANAAAENLLEQSARRLIGRPLAEFLRFDDVRIGAALNQPDTNLAAHGMRVQHRPQQRAQGRYIAEPGGAGRGLATAGAQRIRRRIAPVRKRVRARKALRYAGQISWRTRSRTRSPPSRARRSSSNASSMVPGRRLSGLITAEVDRIALLIDQMQSLTRRTAAPMRPCNIYEPLCAGSARSSRPRIPDRVRFVEQFDPSIPPVLADADNLVQVLLNLITNAREALEGQDDGCITLTTKFVSGVRLRLSRDDRYIRLPVEVRVSDNGPGIDARHRRRHLLAVRHHQEDRAGAGPGAGAEAGARHERAHRARTRCGAGPHQLPPVPAAAPRQGYSSTWQNRSCWSKTTARSARSSWPRWRPKAAPSIIAPRSHGATPCSPTSAMPQS